MSKLTRLSVSLDENLLKEFDDLVEREGYPTRSKAVADLIRESLISEEWAHGKDVAGAIMMVFDHHKRQLVGHLVDVQHDYHDLIAASQHIHLDHDNCLEVVVVRGKPARVQELHRKLKGTKGVKYAGLTMASTGKHL
ncbi:MAG: nickel-responsive transcriptional regulator NikR [Verrucomicrobia bacterium]|nr:nickel-responsive transcriptional regulator NikR [Verrucomicrobiota bacterium]